MTSQEQDLLWSLGSNKCTSCTCHAALSGSSIVCLDGGLGTTLEALGCDIKHELWNAHLLATAAGKQSIKTAHALFLAAGADVITTSSYQATLDGFKKHLVASDAEAMELFRTSVQLAVQARDEFWTQWHNSSGCTPECRAHCTNALGGRSRPLVCVSAGSFGATLNDGSEFSGDYGAEHGNEDFLTTFHSRRLAVLTEVSDFRTTMSSSPRGADMLAFETVPCLTEARAILSALNQLNESTHATRPTTAAVVPGGSTVMDETKTHSSEPPLKRGRASAFLWQAPFASIMPEFAHVPVWISFSCKSATELCSGELFADAVKEVLLWTQASSKKEQPAATFQVVGIGINCTNPAFVCQLLLTASVVFDVFGKEQCSAPLLLCYPNSGELWDSDTMGWVGDSGLELAGWRELVRSWIAAGARLVGGCCRTGPDHIKVLRDCCQAASSLPFPVSVRLSTALGRCQAAKSLLKRWLSSCSSSPEFMTTSVLFDRYTREYVQSVLTHVLSLPPTARSTVEDYCW